MVEQRVPWSRVDLLAEKERGEKQQKKFCFPSSCQPLAPVVWAVARRCPLWIYGADLESPTGLWVTPGAFPQGGSSHPPFARGRDFSSLLHKVLPCLLQLPRLSARKGRKKKGLFWGIEVAETLRWRGWELGKETIKHLILKNVHEKTQKLSYRCVASFLLLLLPRLSLHLHPSCSRSHFSSFSRLRFPLFPWAMCCRQRTHAGVAGQKDAHSDAQPSFLAGVF